MSINPREIPTGAVRYNTDSNKMEVYIGSTWMEVSVSSPNLDGGARGVMAGGSNDTPSSDTNYNVIQKVEILSSGNAVDFGDLLATINSSASASNGHGGL